MSEKFTIERTISDSSSKQVLTRAKKNQLKKVLTRSVGIGSNSHVLDANFEKMAFRSSTEIEVKLASGTP